MCMCMAGVTQSAPPGMAHSTQLLYSVEQGRNAPCVCLFSVAGGSSFAKSDLKGCAVCMCSTHQAFSRKASGSDTLRGADELRFLLL